MKHNKPSLKEAETAAARLLRQPLRTANSARRRAEALLREIVSTLVSDDPLAWAKVQAILLSRIASDLRLAGYAASHGYPLQAMTLGSSIFELSIMAAYVGNANDRADHWLSWSTAERLPWSLRQMEEDVYATLGKDPKRDARYAALCWGKHGNPLLQKSAPVVSNPDDHLLGVDPLLGNKAHILAAFSLWASLWPVIVYTIVAREKGIIPSSLRPLEESLAAAWRDLDDEWQLKRPKGENG